MPRHPPFALRNLTTKIKNCNPLTTTSPPEGRPTIASDFKDARVHCVVLNIRSAPHPTDTNASASCGPPKNPDGSLRRLNPRNHHPHWGSDREAWSLRTQQRAPADPLTTDPSQPASWRTRAGSCAPDCTVNVPPMSYPSDTFGPNQAPGPTPHLPTADTGTSQMLLRKEVIQPHLPVRLPCYDLVLITDPTFDGSFHKG